MPGKKKGLKRKRGKFPLFIYFILKLNQGKVELDFVSFWGGQGTTVIAGWSFSFVAYCHWTRKVFSLSFNLSNCLTATKKKKNTHKRRRRGGKETGVRCLSASQSATPTFSHGV